MPGRQGEYRESYQFLRVLLEITYAFIGSIEVAKMMDKWARRWWVILTFDDAQIFERAQKKVEEITFGVS